MMPYPLLDESQERYRTVVHDTAEVGCIPASAKDPEMSSAVAQLLCELSYEMVKPAYYETTLKVKHARDDDTAKIIDLIYNGIYSQFEIVAGSGYFNDIFTWTFLEPLQKKGDSIATAYATRETAALEGLEKLLTNFPK